MLLEVIKPSNEINKISLQKGDILLKNTAPFPEKSKISKIKKYFFIPLNILLNLFNISLKNRKIKRIKWEKAAIACDNTGMLIEVNYYKGITQTPLAKEDDYIIYRCLNKKIAEASANFAKMIFELKEEEEGEDKFGYSIENVLKILIKHKGNISSPKDIENFINALFPQNNITHTTTATTSHTIFCSQFIALCYIIGAEQNNTDPNEFISVENNIITPINLIHIFNEKPHKWEFVNSYYAQNI